MFSKGELQHHASQFPVTVPEMLGRISETETWLLFKAKWTAFSTVYKIAIK